jgi:hypothetical protein
LHLLQGLGVDLGEHVAAFAQLEVADTAVGDQEPNKDTAVPPLGRRPQQDVRLPVVQLAIDWWIRGSLTWEAVRAAGEPRGIVVGSAQHCRTVTSRPVPWADLSMSP